jgi:hypothetical protein
MYYICQVFEYTLNVSFIIFIDFILSFGIFVMEQFLFVFFIINDI